MLRSNHSATQTKICDGRRHYVRLAARLARRYALRTRHIAIGAARFDITGVADPDQVLLEMEHGIRACGEQPRWQPYWAQSWESAVAISEALIEQDLTESRVLDLGCGLGLAGTVAASRGAHVTFADAAQPSLLFARYNSWPWREQIRALPVDWRADLLGQTYDLIVGADIVYDVTDWRHLDLFWRRHLRRGGCVLLGEPSRDSADGLGEFLQQRGWQVGISQFAVPESVRPIRMFALTELGEGLQ